MKWLLIFPIKVYQLCIAPLIGSTCKYTPSCSRYAIEAIKKKGVFVGSYLALHRIIRCNPWHCGYGNDPVPTDDL